MSELARHICMAANLGMRDDAEQAIDSIVAERDALTREVDRLRTMLCTCLSGARGAVEYCPIHGLDADPPVALPVRPVPGTTTEATDAHPVEPICIVEGCDKPWIYDHVCEQHYVELHGPEATDAQ